MAFSPIVEVLRGLTGDGASPDGLPPVLARLVPGLPGDPWPPPSSQAELFQAFLGLLERLAADRTVVLVLEDLHWADRSTRQLLAFVVHALRSQPLLVVVTYRADDLHRQHPLRPLLAEPRRNPRARRIELSPFAPAEVAEYLAAATGSRPSPETVAPWSTGPRATPPSSRSCSPPTAWAAAPCPSRSATCWWSGSRPSGRRPPRRPGRWSPRRATG
jgi:hypothetical protein